MALFMLLKCSLYAFSCSSIFMVTFIIIYGYNSNEKYLNLLVDTVD